jgi:hypothetical protein
MEGYASVVNCQGDSRNVERGLGAKKITSWFSKLKISIKKCVPDTAVLTMLRTVKKTTGKCVNRITSGTGGIRYKQLGSKNILSPWRSGLQTAADRMRRAAVRTGRACSKRLGYIKIPSSWRSGQQTTAHHIGRIARIYGEPSSGTRILWFSASTDAEESLLTETATSEDITGREVFVLEDDLRWNL